MPWVVFFSSVCVVGVLRVFLGFPGWFSLVFVGVCVGVFSALSYGFPHGFPIFSFFKGFLEFSFVFLHCFPFFYSVCVGFFLALSLGFLHWFAVFGFLVFM